jgi:hypothetical protein
MRDFIKKLVGKKPESSCCGVDIKEVQEAEVQSDCCCGSSEENDFCCK